MARAEKAHALILGRRKTGEADQQLFLLTRERGLRRVMAKGVRKIPSRRGGHLEPLTKIVALLSGHYLTAAEAVATYPALQQDTAAAEQAVMLGDVLLKLLPEGQPSAHLFMALDEAWQLLPELEPARRYVLEATVRLQILREAGLSPALERCLRCGRQQPEEAVVLWGEVGGWHCLSCYGRWAGTRHSLSPTLLKALRWLDRYPERALRLQSSQEEATQLVTATRQYTTVVAYG